MVQCLLLSKIKISQILLIRNNQNLELLAYIYIVKHKHKNLFSLQKNTSVFLYTQLFPLWKKI